MYDICVYADAYVSYHVYIYMYQTYYITYSVDLDAPSRENISYATIPRSLLEDLFIQA